MAEPRDTLIPPVAPAQARTRVSRRVVGIVLLGALALLLLVLWWKLPRPGKTERARLERAPSEDIGTGALGLVGDPQKRTGSYESLAIIPAQPPPRVTQAPPGPATAPPPGTPFRIGDNVIPPRPSPPPPLSPPPVMPEPPAGRGQPQQGRPPPKPPERWFAAVAPPRGDVLQAPFPQDPKDKDQQSKLFPKAVWEKPKDPYKILYADQIVQCALAQNISSDFPGTIRCKVTEAVMDRWGHGHVLIPLDTTFIGVQQGAAQFGQTRIPATITQAIFPDGTALQWQKAQMGDQLGANGIPADVDNHYAKLLLGVGLQALLSIGVRAPFGSTQGFQQSLPQEFAQDASQGINQAGQRIIQQQFQAKPTLSQEHGFPVTISFLENVSLMSPAVEIKQ